MSDSLLLIINKADLQITSDFQGILGLGLPKTRISEGTVMQQLAATRGFESHFDSIFCMRSRVLAGFPGEMRASQSLGRRAERLLLNAQQGLYALPKALQRHGAHVLPHEPARRSTAARSCPCGPEDDVQVKSYSI